MINIQLTAAAMARVFRAEVDRITAEIAQAAADGRVPTEPDAYWGWVHEGEKRIAALEAAARLYESLPPELLVVEGEKLAPPPRRLTLWEKAHAIGAMP